MTLPKKILMLPVKINKMPNQKPIRPHRHIRMLWQNLKGWRRKVHKKIMKKRFLSIKRSFPKKGRQIQRPKKQSKKQMPPRLHLKRFRRNMRLKGKLMMLPLRRKNRHKTNLIRWIRGRSKSTLTTGRKQSTAGKRKMSSKRWAQLKKQLIKRRFQNSKKSFIRSLTRTIRILIRTIIRFTTILTEGSSTGS